MKHLKKFEEIEVDELLAKARKIEVDSDEKKKRLCKELIEALENLMKSAYPNVKIEISKEKGLYMFDREYKFLVKNISEYPELWSWRGREWPDYLEDWIMVERELFSVGIHFGIRTYDTMNINKFIISKIKPYQTNHNHEYIIFFKYNDIPKIISEITPENFSFYGEVEKYNL